MVDEGIKSATATDNNNLEVMDNEADSDYEKEVPIKKKEDVNESIELIPPLLPMKLGNGLLLQYTVNTPGLDDKLYFLEIGFMVGITSLILVLVNVLLKYLVKSAPSFISDIKESELKRTARISQVFNVIMEVTQVCLIVFLFVYSLVMWGSIDFDDKQSDNYVKKRVFYFSLIISSIMFISAILGAVGLSYLYCRKPRDTSSNSPSKLTLPPAGSLLPLGLANALLGLYIAIPGDDSTVLGPEVYLLDLCLGIGALTVLMTVLLSLVHIWLRVALIDGKIDHGEETLLHSASKALKNGKKGFKTFSVYWPKKHYSYLALYMTYHNHQKSYKLLHNFSPWLGF